MASEAVETTRDDESSSSSGFVFASDDSCDEADQKVAAAPTSRKTC